MSKKYKGGYMRHTLKICFVVLCVFSVAFANQHARTPGSNNKPSTYTIDNQPTPYRPSLRQGGVLFVEDNSQYGPPTHPDPLWDTVLTHLFGTGNYGWFGPTMGPFEDGPDLATMQNYDVVIWNNYDHWDDPTLTENDTANIKDYINGGGKVWLIAQDLVYSGVELSFLQANFHVNSVIEDYISGGPTTTLQGLAEITGPSFSVTCDYDLNGFYPDDITPDAEAHDIVLDTDWTQNPGILRNDSLASFWAIDGRGPNPFSTWEQLVRDMLLVFGVTGVEELPSKKMPMSRLRIMAVPSAFHNTTTIKYTVPIPEQIQIHVYNKYGAYVTTLVDKHHNTGSYIVNWNGTYANGTKVASGVYFCRMTCSDHSCTTKLIMVK
jgi:hypothetical protein